MKKLYEFSFKEFNGEQEYYSNKLIYAENKKEALKIGKKYLENWYEDEDVEKIENGYSFFGGTLAVKYVNEVYEINKEEYLEELFKEKLIG